MNADKLYLVGFMGARTTTIARALSRRLGWPARDIDESIEARERRSVAAIFTENGEPYFRRAEREILHELVPARNVIVSTGGGTFADPENRALMLSDGSVIWLDIPLSAVVARIPPDGRRPLAADLTQMEQLYFRRQIAYADAHLRVDATRPVDEVVERVLEGIGD